MFSNFALKILKFQDVCNLLVNLLKSVIFRRNFHGILSELREMLNDFQKSRRRKKRRNLQNVMKNNEILPKILLSIYLSLYLSINLSVIFAEVC